MPRQMEFISTESEFGVTIQHRLLHARNPSTKLMAILPGRGYTTDNPLLHYMRRVGSAQGYDVLLVTYGFYLTQEMNISMPKVHADGTNAVKKALEGGYDEICIVGKSLGTPIAADLGNSLDIQRKSLLLLTPIQNSAAMVKDVPTLAVIGTADPAYEAASIKERPNLQWNVYEGLNHSLEYGGDWQASIDILKRVMLDCERWLMAQATN